MRKIGIIVGLLYLVLLPLMAAERDTLECPVRPDSSLIKTLFNSSMFKGNTQDSLIRARHERTFFHRLGKTFTTFFREFSNIDERYIEPQHFNYTVMLQNTFLAPGTLSGMAMGIPGLYSRPEAYQYQGQS